MITPTMMKISTKGRYALRIMIDLARHDSEGPVSLRAVAERQNITLKYMESIIAMLMREKLVISVRGKSGGYRLSRQADQYCVYDILCAVEGDLAPVQCLAEHTNTCIMRDHCATLPLWTGLCKVVKEYLEQFSLADLSAQEGDLTYCDGI